MERPAKIAPSPLALGYVHHCTPMSGSRNGFRCHFDLSGAFAPGFLYVILGPGHRAHAPFYRVAPPPPPPLTSEDIHLTRLPREW